MNLFFSWKETTLSSPGYDSKTQCVLALITGVIFLSLSSYATIPSFPVPTTLQTFSVTLIGALYGPGPGAITVIAWLLCGFSGMPVFAGGAGGLQYLFQPTAGYLLAFPGSAIIAGMIPQTIKGQTGYPGLFSAMLAAHAFSLVCGASWLAFWVGPEQAITLGIIPFLFGDILKATAGASLLFLLRNPAFHK